MGRSWALLGRPWALLGALGGLLGHSLAALGVPMDAPWALWRRSWRPVGRLWALGRVYSLPSLPLSLPSATDLGCSFKSWGAPSHLGVLLALLGRFGLSLACSCGILGRSFSLLGHLSSNPDLFPCIPGSGSLVPWAWFLASWSLGLVPWFPISGFPDFLGSPDSHG